MRKTVHLAPDNGEFPINQNLFVPGVDADGNPRFLVNSPLYWKNQSVNHTAGAAGDCYLPEVHDAFKEALGYSSLVCLTQTNVETGEIERRVLTPNLLVDNGGVQLLKLFTSAAGGLGQYIVLDTNAATSQLSGSVGSSVTLSTLNTSNGPAVIAGGNASLVTGNAASTFISNTTSTPCSAGASGALDPSTGGGISLGFGLATVDFFAGSGTQGSATNVKAATGITHNTHNANEWVVAAPQVTDGPAGTLPGTAIIYNSAASTNAATATATNNSTPTGSGIGNRTVTYNGFVISTSSTAGSYNNLWIVTANTVAGNSAATNYLTHLSFTPLVVNNSSTITITYSIRV